MTTLAGALTAGRANGAGTVARFTQPYDVALNGAGTFALVVSLGAWGDGGHAWEVYECVSRTRCEVRNVGTLTDAHHRAYVT